MNKIFQFIDYIIYGDEMHLIKHKSKKDAEISNAKENKEIMREVERNFFERLFRSF